MTTIDVNTLPVIPVRENLGGSVVRVDGDSGASLLRYVPGEHLNNTVGTIFGGYLAAIVDDVAGITAWFGGTQRPFATARMSVNFLVPVEAGQVLMAEGRVSDCGERQIEIEVSMRREVDGQSVVTGRVVQAFLPGKRQ